MGKYGKCCLDGTYPFLLRLGTRQAFECGTSSTTLVSKDLRGFLVGFSLNDHYVSSLRIIRIGL